MESILNFTIKPILIFTINFYKKNFLIGLFVLGLTWSCTTDSADISVNETPNAHVMRTTTLSLQEVYDDMIKSPEYIDYQNALDTFITKMRPDALDETFTNELQILDWINTHLSMTTFASYADADGQWKAINGKLELALTSHLDFLGNWDDTDWEKLEIPTEESGTSSDDPCKIACSNTAIDGFALAAAVYRAALRQANVLAALNPTAGSSAIAVATAQLRLTNNNVNQKMMWCMCLCDPDDCPN